MLFWKKLCSLIKYGSIDILIKLETVQHKCTKILHLLDERIELQQNNAIEIKSSINECEGEISNYKLIIQQLSSAFLKAHKKENIEDMDTINNEISIHEQLLNDISISYDNSLQYYTNAIEELNIVKRERGIIEGKLRLAISRYNIAKREQKYLSNASSYNSIEKEVKDITKTVNEAVSRAKAIRQVQQDTIPETKMIEAKYGAATMSVEDRLNQIKQVGILTIK